MDFLKSSKRRSAISEIVYIGLNVALAAAILAIVLVVESPLFAFAVVLLGKWRILAVRPRYWFANIQANLVDIIVSLSVVILLYAASGALAVQVFLTLLYVVWLLFIKPRSKRIFVAAQAGTAIFLGVSALLIVSPNWFAAPVVLLMWLIGYSAARHVLSSHDEVQLSFYSLLWGFVFAELGWLVYHWTLAYSPIGTGPLKLAQGALIALAISFIAERVYSSYARHGSVRSSDVLLPVSMSVVLIIILVLFYNQISMGVL